MFNTGRKLIINKGKIKMSIQEILCIGSNILFIILTLVEITPIKINPWKFIARKLGSFLNVEINEKLDELKIQTNNQINELKKDISDLNKKSKQY